ncbi:nuclear transport factor 2 family protein [Algibacter sp. PT7-4]|uniref:nuclear transport factor 2 family protein n=1 Tax=Algibacter ulvanivorans TaxID=3400999 RepID=UPI003AAB4401
MKHYFLLCCMLLAFSAATAQTNDKALIETTINYYLEGTSYNKTDVIKKAFTKDATLYLKNRDGEDILWSIDFYADLFSKREYGKYNGRKGTFLSVEVINDIATAQAEIIFENTNKRYVDLFLLKRLNTNEWKIVSKTATVTN